MNKILTKDQIRQVDDRPIETIPVPEWNGHVLMKVPGAVERDMIEEAFFIGEKHGYKGLRAQLVSLCVVNEDGTLMFTEDDIEMLGKKSAQVIDRLFTVALRLFGFSEKEMAKVKRNLPEGQSDDSTSG